MAAYFDGLSRVLMESHKDTRTHEQHRDWEVYVGLSEYVSQVLFFLGHLTINWKPRSQTQTWLTKQFFLLCVHSCHMQWILFCLIVNVDTNDGVLQSNCPSCANGLCKWANPNAKPIKWAYFGTTVSSTPQPKSPSPRPLRLEVGQVGSSNSIKPIPNVLPVIGNGTFAVFFLLFCEIHTVKYNTYNFWHSNGHCYGNEAHFWHQQLQSLRTGPSRCLKVKLTSACGKSSTLCVKRLSFPTFSGHPGPIYPSGKLFHLQSLQLKRWEVKWKVEGERRARQLLSGRLPSAGFSSGLLMGVRALIIEVSLRS